MIALRLDRVIFPSTGICNDGKPLWQSRICAIKLHVPWQAGLPFFSVCCFHQCLIYQTLPSLSHAQSSIDMADLSGKAHETSTDVHKAATKTERELSTSSTDSSNRPRIWPCSGEAGNLHVPQIPNHKDVLNTIGTDQQTIIEPLHAFINFIHNYSLRGAEFLPADNEAYGDRMQADAFTSIREVQPAKFSYYEAHKLMFDGVDWKFRPAKEGVQEAEDLKEMAEVGVKCEECDVEYFVGIHHRSKKAQAIADVGFFKEPGSESEIMTGSGSLASFGSSDVSSRRLSEAVAGRVKRHSDEFKEKGVEKRSKGSDSQEQKSESSKNEADDEGSTDSQKSTMEDENGDGDTPKAKKTADMVGTKDAEASA